MTSSKFFQDTTRINSRANTIQCFINDLLLHIKSTNTYNYADDNTLSAHGDTANEVTKILEKGSEEALSWFLCNAMSENADIFQAILYSQSYHFADDTHLLNINDSAKKQT